MQRKKLIISDSDEDHFKNPEREIANLRPKKVNSPSKRTHFLVEDNENMEEVNYNPKATDSRRKAKRVEAILKPDNEKIHEEEFNKSIEVEIRNPAIKGKIRKRDAFLTQEDINELHVLPEIENKNRIRNHSQHIGREESGQYSSDPYNKTLLMKKANISLNKIRESATNIINLPNMVISNPLVSRVRTACMNITRKQGQVSEEMKSSFTLNNNNTVTRGTKISERRSASVDNVSTDVLMSAGNSSKNPERKQVTRSRTEASQMDQIEGVEMSSMSTRERKEAIELERKMAELNVNIDQIQFAAKSGDGSSRNQIEVERQIAELQREFYFDFQKKSDSKQRRGINRVRESGDTETTSDQINMEVDNPQNVRRITNKSRSQHEGVIEDSLDISYSLSKDKISRGQKRENERIRSDSKLASEISGVSIENKSYKRETNVSSNPRMESLKTETFGINYNIPILDSTKSRRSIAKKQPLGRTAF